MAIWLAGAPYLAASGEPPTLALRHARDPITDEDREYWAFQSVRRPTTPAVIQTNLAANPLDLFVLAELEAHNLAPNPRASRRVLIRRAYFDLIGLPPSPEAVTAFEANPSRQAWEELIDSLLALPQYGERWARHWLDLVRFGETNGYERDGAKPNAWRYRDYVIQSLNDDKPYDQFLLEQIAGDELDVVTDASLVATGLYRLHVWDDEPDDTLAAEFDELDDHLSTIGSAFMGLTISCARCHDHKFDPIPQRDYYQLLSFFRSVQPYGLQHKGGGSRPVGHILRPLGPPQEVEAWQKDRDARLAQAKSRLADEKDESTRKQIEDELKAIQTESPPHGEALAIGNDSLKATHLLMRGVASQPADQVEPAFLSVLGGEKPRLISGATSAAGRRRAFAEWLIRDDHPLTARVFVNRLWKHHFGRGIVGSPNDFGRTGLAPRNQALLDFLAAEFVGQGWKIKRMHKSIMMSETYQRSSNTDRPEALRIDESNNFLWRQELRRVEAEVVRDTALAVSGALNLKAGGPGFFPTLPPEVHSTQDSSGKGWGHSVLSEQSRRSIYIYAKRALPLPLLECFDGAESSVSVGERAVTTVAPQGLMLLNDPFMVEQAALLAERLGRDAGFDLQHQVRRAFELVVQRLPSAAELSASLAMIHEQARAVPGHLRSDADKIALRQFCAAMLNLNEMIYVD